MKILIIDDDVALSEGIALYLSTANSEFEVIVENNGNAAMKTIERISPDFIILDILLKDVSGYDLCKKIKQLSDVPIIFLSSLGAEEDRVRGLLSGGDDYLSKPFSLQELLLRINARLRDKGLRKVEGNLNAVHNFGEVKLSCRNLVGGRQDVPLTETEYNILLLLARNEGTTISLGEIYKVVWGVNYSHDLRTVQTHIANLKKKLEEAYGANKHIRTQWGQGYIFQS